MDDFDSVDEITLSETKFTINCFENYIPEEQETEDYDLEKLKSLLNHFNLLQLLPTLQAANVTYRCLQYIQKEDLIEAIPHLGLRVEFREKLFMWRKHNKQFEINDEILSNSNKVQERLNRNCTNGVSPSSSNSTMKRLLNKDIKNYLKYLYPSKSEDDFAKIQKFLDLQDILSRTSKGYSCLEIYKQCQKLTDQNRDDIINIIVDEIICNNITLKPNDFGGIVNDICEIFPSETVATEYYYIPRQPKKNPSGKLYSKYVNARCKRIKKSDLPATEEKCDEQNVKVIEMDEDVALALKTTLNRDITNWEQVCEKWKKTFYIRQKDLKRLNNYDFLTTWSKYSDGRAYELIKIDFNIIYPDKEYMLYAKWDKFKEKIITYFEDNIHNTHCKQLLSLVKTTEHKNAEDYILAKLLTGVLLTAARFKDEDGKIKKKITIIDAQESFLLRLASLNNYEAEIAERRSKYYSIGLTIEPLIIVEGHSDITVKSFYVYFNKTLYKLSSLIESLDICFKIFHVFSLKYPLACEEIWVFIQKFFYQISTANDIKSAKITSILTFMNNKSD